jgi:hypothetical protein
MQDTEGSSSSSTEGQQPAQPASSSSSTAVDGSSNPTIAGAENKQLQVSKEVIETLRNKVFGKYLTYMKHITGAVLMVLAHRCLPCTVSVCWEVGGRLPVRGIWCRLLY